MSIYSMYILHIAMAKKRQMGRKHLPAPHLLVIATFLSLIAYSSVAMQ